MQPSAHTGGIGQHIEAVTGTGLEVLDKHAMPRRCTCKQIQRGNSPGWKWCCITQKVPLCGGLVAEVPPQLCQMWPFRATVALDAQVGMRRWRARGVDEALMTASVSGSPKVTVTVATPSTCRIPD